MTNGSVITLSWLQKVWSMLLNHKPQIESFKELPLLPILQNGDWSHYEINLISLSTRFMLLRKRRDGIQSEVFDCLRCFGAEVVDELPTWIPENKIKSFVKIDTYEGIENLLSDLACSKSVGSIASEFNNKANFASKKQFLDFIIKCQRLDKHVVHLLSKLRMFSRIKTIINGTTDESSVELCQRFICESATCDFPENISFPCSCLIVRDEEKALVQRLGGNEITVLDFMEEVLGRQNWKNTEEKLQIMDFFSLNFEKFKKKKSLIDRAKSVPFLYNGNSDVKAQDVFDSSDPRLLHLFHGQNMLPEKRKGCAHLSFNFDVLRALGLKTYSDIQPNDLLKVAQSLDSWTKAYNMSKEQIETTAKQVLECIHNNTTFLSTQVQVCSSLISRRQTLGEALKQLSFMPMTQCDLLQYAPCLLPYHHPLFLCKPSEARVENHWKIVGSTMPLVRANADIVKFFGLNEKSTS